MTDTAEKLLPCQQMLPCLHCKQTSGLFTHEERGANYAGCHECNIQTACFVTLKDAVAAWNRRAAEKPKWTTETPTASGLYWVYFDNDAVLPVQLEWGNFYKRLYVSLLGQMPQPLDLFLENNDNVYWADLDIPALPEEEEAT